MNWLDFTLIAVIAIGTLLGVWTGPLWQVYRVFSIILAVVSSYFLHKLLRGIFGGMFTPAVSDILSYAVVFFVVLLLTYAIGSLYRSFFTRRKFGANGRILGGGIALIKTTLICCIIISGISFMENNGTSEVINNSFIAHNLDKGTRDIISRVPQSLKQGPPANGNLMTKNKTTHEKE